MVTVLGHSGYLGAVVERRWREQGWDTYRFDGNGNEVICTFDDLHLIRRLARSGPGIIVPSTDAIAEATEYAERKRAIEAIPGIVVIRSGIVDLRKDNTYTNWYCNPLTPLEWADLAWEKRDAPGVHVAGRETVSRWEIGRGESRLAPRESWRVQPVDRDRPPLREALREFTEWLVHQDGFLRTGHL